MQLCLPIGRYVMATAENREPYESREPRGVERLTSSLRTKRAWTSHGG
jgi:hypothetical protein